MSRSADHAASFRPGWNPRTPALFTIAIPRFGTIVSTIFARTQADRGRARGGSARHPHRQRRLQCDTSDQITVVPMLTRLHGMGLRNVCWVADRGMTSEKNLASVRAAGLHYIVGVRLRAAEDLGTPSLKDEAPYAS